ncbi:MAG: ubiquinol-cytochrome c reductase, partial [Pseudomonadales bacterium]|nr:ubiquinol-cytochrome c reductase [Pseudomonadales bacterium]
YTVHDLQAIAVFLFAFCFVMFFMPELGGLFLEKPNFEIANPLKTPEHIAPVWYFTPYYSILRAIPDKFWGFIFFAASVAIPFLLPWLDRSPVRSIRYRGRATKVALVLFISSFIILGVLGVWAPTDARTNLARICSVIYFGYFLLMPFYTSMEKTKPEPDRITTSGGMGLFGSLGVLALILALAILPLKVVAAESAYDCGAIPCADIEVDLYDNAAMQRGAATFVNYCMGCHSAKYMRWGRLAEDLDIPEELAKKYLVTGRDTKIGALMHIAMPESYSKKVFGAAPPDLTLAARVRSPEWLYTYLTTFYKDESRPYGVNNLVFKDVGMPHVLQGLQGEQICRPPIAIAANGGQKRDAAGNPIEDTSHGDCGRVVPGDKQGRMSTEEYQSTMRDLVTFMTYMAEPAAMKRERLGVGVLFFIAVFFVFAYLLNREYWKDVDH